MMEVPLSSSHGRGGQGTPYLRQTSSGGVGECGGRCRTCPGSKYDAPGVLGRHQQLQLALFELPSLPLRPRPTLSASQQPAWRKGGGQGGRKARSWAVGSSIEPLLELEGIGEVWWASCRSTVSRRRCGDCMRAWRVSIDTAPLPNHTSLLAHTLHPPTAPSCCCRPAEVVLAPLWRPSRAPSPPRHAPSAVNNS